MVKEGRDGLLRVLYLDAFSGLSGDMILGGLIHLGVPREHILEELVRLPIKGYELESRMEAREGIQGVRVDIKVAVKEQHHRSMEDIKGMLESSSMDPWVKGLSLRIFQRLAEAEGAVHGIPWQKVHFHEVGAVDSIVDVVGSAIGFAYLAPKRVVCSPLVLGGGFARGRHGVLPVPAPATLEVLKGVPVRQAEIDVELVTPTGAAIVTEVADSFGPMPPMRPLRIGYGVGSRKLKERPNLLRLILGESVAEGLREDWIIEANVDDMNPQICQHLTDLLLKEGAKDVGWSPLFMKKGRPGVLLRVIAAYERRDALMELILRESTSIGVRTFQVQRMCLERDQEVVETQWGPVRIKVSRREGEIVNAMPEYDDCRRLAIEKGIPLKEVFQEALSIYRSKRNPT